MQLEIARGQIEICFDLVATARGGEVVATERDRQLPNNQPKKNDGTW